MHKLFLISYKLPSYSFYFDIDIPETSAKRSNLQGHFNIEIVIAYRKHKTMIYNSHSFTKMCDL